MCLCYSAISINPGEKALAIPTSRSRDLERVFDEQNPWHETGRVDAVSAPPTERPLAALLWRRLMDRRLPRYQLIVGPRRVGKTTVLYQTVRRLLGEGVSPRRVWWLRMDHPLLMQQSLGDLAREVLQRSDAAADRPVFLMLDELVYAADWDVWLKTFCDDRWPVKVAATSSATAALRKRRHESGVGRWEVQYLTPYLLTEYLDLVGQPHETHTGDTLAETLQALRRGERAPREAADGRKSLMLTGGFPELLDPARRGPGEDERDRLLRSQQVLRSDAVERAVYKDIPQSFGVGNPLMLERLLYVLAGQMTGVLSPTNVCKELGMSQPTFDSYLSYLESAFLVFTLPNFSGREATVQKRGRKLFFLDGAVRNAALQRGPALLRTSWRWGPCWRTWRLRPCIPWQSGRGSVCITGVKAGTRWIWSSNTRAVPWPSRSLRPRDTPARACTPSWNATRSSAAPATWWLPRRPPSTPTSPPREPCPWTSS